MSSAATRPPAAPPQDPATALTGSRGTGDRFAAALARAGTGLTVLVLVAFVVFLAAQSASAPQTSGSGLGPLLVWAFGAAAVAVGVSVPVGAGAALFATRLAPRPARRLLGAAIDLLAAVPAISYLLVAQGVIDPSRRNAERAVITGLALTAAVTPTVAALSREVFRQVPAGRMEASFALGATRWEMIRQAVLPFSAQTLRSTAALAFARALAEALTLVALFSGLRPDRLRLAPDGSRSQAWHLARLAGGDELGRFIVAVLAVVLAGLVLGLGVRALLARRPPVRVRRERGAGRPAGATARARAIDSSLTGVRLPRWANAALAGACLLVAALLGVLSGTAVLPATLIGAALAYPLVHQFVMFAVEGPRNAVDAACHDLCAVAFALAVLPLAALLARVVLTATAGAGVLFSASVLAPVGGTLVTIAVAAAVSVPVGLAGAVWSSEYSGRRGARIVSSLADAAVSVPALTAGLLVLMVFVLLSGPARVPGRGAAVAALCTVMIPYLMRGATQMLGLVPVALREQGLALGAATWSVILRVTLPTASAGLVQAAVLAVSRALGAASLMLVLAGPGEPTAAASSLPGWVADRFAAGEPGELWAGVVWLVAIVVALNLAGRLIPARLGPRNIT
ncbi:ABC transporter permease subunit [Propionibacterium australiense]|uniref:ABC transporter permease subunit n=1 Tax=Propionibacterium australiense TaxID=119981 RepID=A0A8B3FP61_9ACTN|nr:ABC transporter permease subunit [Propionibacterium australiense]RLP09048.1 ABC transporter permease subunit [Propionibacterium australiense]